MDIALPIYKADDITILLNKSDFTVTNATDYEISLPILLAPGTVYEIMIDFLTGAAYYLDMYVGTTKAVSFNETGEVHRTVTRSYTPAAAVTAIKLRLVAGSAISSSRVRNIKILTRISHDASDTRYVAEKWEFHDSVMGDRYISFTAKSPVPIDWRLNDWALFRGQKYYLNYVPSCVQSGGEEDKGDSFVYESIRFDDEQGKLADCMILDITPTTGDYVASLGTNYTGSSVFSVYCATTAVTMVDGSGAEFPVTLSPVEYVGGIIQANLNRLYPTEGWRVQVNPNLPYLDDKVLSFNKMYVPAALKLIHDTWDVDYIVIGRTIKIGYTLNNITEDTDGNILTFGYGEGYNTVGNDGKALFKIRRTSNSSQKIITRLRAMGSTRNMPYRYYNNKYELPQSMFVANLQLPDTFESPETKNANNSLRDETYGMDADGYPNLRHILGDSNDAYIDKHDDAANCPDGIREGAAFWDGSDSNLEEIYPTIQSGTYLDLRSANIPDMDGRVPSAVGPQNAYPNYADYERIDEILGVDEQTTNIGDGIMAESDVSGQQERKYNVELPQTSSHIGAEPIWTGTEVTLFSVNEEQSVGNYMMAATTQHVVFKAKLTTASTVTANAGYQIKVYQIPSDGSEESVIGIYRSMVQPTVGEWFNIIMADLPDNRKDQQSGGSQQVPTLTLTKKSRVRATVAPIFQNLHYLISHPDDLGITWCVLSEEDDVEPKYVWKPVSATDLFVNQPFDIYIKDIGIDITEIQTTGSDATIHFNTGQCGGMEFKFNPNEVEPITVGAKKGWKLHITERVKDDTLHVYYPNMNNRIEAGDQYVLLNIEFPEVYIKMAEIRLLNAATKYLADNCETKFIYEPEVDDIYLQYNIDRCEANGDITKSIWYNIYAGYKFSMRGIPDASGSTPPLIDNITIASVTIRMGEKLTPAIEITLNNDIEQSTIQKLTTSVDRIYNSVFNLRGGGGGATRLSQLTDTLIGTLSPFQFLEWNGTFWQNADALYYYDADSESDGWMTMYIRSGGYDLFDFTHTHAFEDIVDLPGTLGGYGIKATDPLFSLATAGYANALKHARYLWGNAFDGTADVDGPITITNGNKTITLSVDDDGWLHINGNVYADGDVSSLGKIT